MTDKSASLEKPSQGFVEWSRAWFERNKVSSADFYVPDMLRDFYAEFFAYTEQLKFERKLPAPSSSPLEPPKHAVTCLANRAFREDDDSYCTCKVPSSPLESSVRGCWCPANSATCLTCWPEKALSQNPSPLEKPCTCGHKPLYHVDTTGECVAKECSCMKYQSADSSPKPAESPELSTSELAMKFWKDRLKVVQAATGDDFVLMVDAISFANKLRRATPSPAPKPAESPDFSKVMLEILQKCQHVDEKSGETWMDMVKACAILKREWNSRSTPSGEKV